MIWVFVNVDGKVVSTELCQATYKCLRDGSAFRKQPLQEYLLQVVQEYGCLSDENILRFMQEKWIL